MSAFKWSLLLLLAPSLSFSLSLSALPCKSRAFTKATRGLLVCAGRGMEKEEKRRGVSGWISVLGEGRWEGPVALCSVLGCVTRGMLGDGAMPGELAMSTRCGSLQNR